MTEPNKFSVSNPRLRELIFANAKITLENGDKPDCYDIDTSNPTLFQLLRAKSKVMFHDGSGVEYAESEAGPYIKAIGPGGKAFAYAFDVNSLHTILDGLGHLDPKELLR